MKKSDVKILLVEDEPTLQYVVERQLEKLGYKVAAVADSGLQAVEKAGRRQFDLVFMDVRLPGIDGITATRRIRAMEQETNRHTKIVGMTAFAERQGCLEAGMDDFLQKPVLLEDLNAMIEKWLNSDGAAPEPEFAALSLSQFQQTASKLNSIQERIINLRKRVGLSDATTMENLGS